MLNERRKIRSDIRSVAAQLYLRAASERGNLAGFVLGDGRGLVIAGHSPERAADALAAFAPLESAHDACAEACSVPPESVHTHPFDLLGQRCYLTAVGSTKPDMAAAATAMGRIFGQ